MCKTMPGHCYSDEEKEILKNKGWTDEQIDFTENSIVEDKIKELLKN